MSRPISQRELCSVCVYCASSRQAHPDYAEAAGKLGGLLARRGIAIVYGGGAVGSMGALADGALAAGGRVIGVLPRFMYDLEMGHPGISDMRLVNDLHERKRMMIEQVDGIVALPGGSGTLEELFEAITWKRLGLCLQPIVMLNIRGYYDRIGALLRHTIAERFMDQRHDEMWSIVDRVEQVIDALDNAPDWQVDARSFSTL